MPQSSIPANYSNNPVVPPTSNGGMTSNEAGSWVDCQAQIVGWFQISDRLNPSTNEYLPETGVDGNPVSGPGWVAYEKPGAQPGDIVIIYRVMTITSTLAPGQNVTASFAGVLWDLLDPCGLSFFTDNYSFKTCISKSDIVSLLPHAGGPLMPLNPNNPNGDPDLLWRNVTTQYGLPGPGNAESPYFIRNVVPGFGIRMLFWSDSCCVYQQIIPPVNAGEVPIINLPSGGPSPNPGGPGPGPGRPGRVPDVLLPGIPGGSTPGGGGGGTTPGNTTPTEPITPPVTPGPRPPSRSKPVFWLNNDTTVQEPTSVVADSTGRRFRRPNIAPVVRNVGGGVQSSFYNTVEGMLYQKRLDPTDFAIYTRAIRVGQRGMYMRNGGMNHGEVLTNTHHITWMPSLSPEQLEAYGLRATATEETAIAGVPQRTMSPAGKAGTTSSDFVIKGATPNQNTDSSSPIRTRRDLHQLTSDQTIGGYSTRRPVDNLDNNNLLHKSITTNVGQVISYKTKPVNIRSGKATQDTTKGAGLRAIEDRNGIARRSPSIINGSLIAAKIGSQASVVKRNQLSIKNFKKTTQPTRMDVIKDQTNRYKVTPIRLSSGNGFTFLVLIEGNIDSRREDVQLITNAMVKYQTGDTDVLSIGGTGYITFGITNPPQPGQYVVANPVCAPGQGSLPDIIAGGQQWTFMSLIFTLLDIESNIIAQSVVNFLPAPPNASDVLAPNRLPVGLMADLELADTSVPNYDGTYSHAGASQSDWFKSEPSVVLEKIGTNASTATIVLKATVNALSASPAFRPILELYSNDLLLSTQNARTAFLGGPCGAQPGWWDLTLGVPRASGGIHTACPGSSGIGGAGGSSAYVTDEYGQIVSGPYNPAMYGHTHQCFLCWKGPDAPQVPTANYYRVRVYNNGPVCNLYGYGLFFANLRVRPTVSGVIIDSAGKLAGFIRTYHTCQTLKIRNMNSGEEIERFTSWEDGTIYLGNGPSGGASGGNNIVFWAPDSRLSAQAGDVIRVFRPGFDNNYASERIVAEIVV